MLSAFNSNTAYQIQPYHSKLIAFARTIDCASIVVAFYLAGVLNGNIAYADYIWFSVLGILSFLLLSDSIGLYALQNKASLSKQVVLTLGAWGGTCLFLMLIWAISLSASISFIVMLTWSIFAFSLIVFSNVIRRKGLEKLRKMRSRNKRFAIYGANPLGLVVHNKILSIDWLAYQFVGFFDDRDASRVADQQAAEVAVSGNFEQLVAASKACLIDAVYIAIPLSQSSRIQQLLKDLADTTVSVYLVPDFNAFDLVAPKWNTLEGLPLVSLFDTPFGVVEQLLKRALDIFVSVAILSIIALPMFVIGLIIKLTSKGPVIFKQLRYGISGETIEVWKFRSMAVVENGNDVVQAKANDVRITPFGRFIRKTSLDELPQFINVLQGRMSIVGPRPHAVSHNEYYRTKVRGYMLRHKVKPGITGLAQINGCRGETQTDDKMNDRVKYDLQYITAWTLLMDINIILKTLYKGFVGKNVY